MHRLIRGVLGQMSGRAMIALYQLAIIPLMITTWGVPLYGEWLILTGLATYLAVSGQGLTTASAMKLIGRIGAEDTYSAQRIIRASFAALLLAAGLFTVVLMAMLKFTDLVSFLSLHKMSEQEIIGVACASIAQIILISMRSITMAICNAAGDYGRPALWSSVIRLLEFTGSALLLVFQQGPLTVASWIALATAFDFGLQAYLAHRQSPELALQASFREWHVLNDLVRPTLGNLGVAFAINGLGVQGFRLVTAALLGSTAVAVLSIYTALLRVSEHCANMVLPVVQLELARQRVEDAHKGNTIALIGLSMVCGVVIAGGYLALLLVIGPRLLQWWTLDTVAFDPALLIILGIAAIFVQISRPSLTYLVSHNLVGKIGLIMMSVWLLTLLGAFPLAGILGLPGVSLAVASGELATLVACIYLAGRSLIGNPMAYTAMIFDFRRGYAVALGQWKRGRSAWDT